MLKYLVYCDFTTLKCNFKQFAKFLGFYAEYYENIGNGVWLVDIDDESCPFYNDLSNIIQDLEKAGYADKDSIIYAAQYSSMTYRHPGLDKTFHIN